MSTPILLILGAGPGIGYSVSKAFAAKGYKVVLSSRKAPATDAGQALHIPADLSKPESVPSIFTQVREKLGSPPNVVIYNAAAMKPLNKEDPLSDFVLEEYNTHLNVDHTSVMVALKEAMAGFKTLNSSVSKSFLFTGNCLNTVRTPSLLTFGIGKNATAYAIQTLAESKVYEKDGISFYYVDERQPNGGPMSKGTDAGAAAEEYPNVVEIKGQGEWLYTFVKGQGYKDFTKIDIKL